MSYDLLVLTGPTEHQTSPVMNYSKADNDTADVSMKAASLRYHKHTKLLCCFLSTEHDTYSDKDKPRHLSQHMDNGNASSAIKENMHGRSQLMAEKSKTASKFETAKSCHLGALLDKSDMTITVYGDGRIMEMVEVLQKSHPMTFSYGTARKIDEYLLKEN